MKKSYGILLALVAAFFLISGCAQKSDSTLPPAKWLTDKQLHRLFVKKTAKSRSVGQGRVSYTYYHSKGKVTQKRDGQYRYGKWRIVSRDDGGRICLKMEDAPEKCRAVAKVNGTYQKYIVKKNGEHKHVVTYINFRGRNTIDKIYRH